MQKYDTAAAFPVQSSDIKDDEAHFVLRITSNMSSLHMAFKKSDGIERNCRGDE